MFGYIRPDIPYMYVKDGVLYKALYCGLCKSIGRSCGQRARFALSYDMTFLSALLHNIAGEDVRIEKEHCVLHPVVRRPVAQDDAITRAVACLNIILTYYKLTDDVEDEGKGRITRSLFKAGFRRAARISPSAADIVKARMGQLSALEKEGCASTDRAADPFAMMIAELSDDCLGERRDEHTRGLFYGIGKWVYLIDALDDYDKDRKKSNYNPFVAAYGCASRAELLEKYGEEVQFTFRAVFAQNAEHLREIRFHFNHDLTDNIILRGLPAATKRVLCGCKDKSKPNKIKYN